MIGPAIAALYMLLLAVLIVWSVDSLWDGGYPIVKARRLGGGSRIDPMLEDGDLLVWPGAIAGHRSVAELLEDRLAVPGNVVV